MSQPLLRRCGLLILCGSMALLGTYGWSSTPKQELKAESSPASLSLTLRYRKETGPSSGRWHTLTKPADWNAKKTAVVICDMWDKHWCQMATQRVGQMAPRMNEFVKEARDNYRSQTVQVADGYEFSQ